MEMMMEMAKIRIVKTEVEMVEMVMEMVKIRMVKMEMEMIDDRNGDGNGDDRNGKENGKDGNGTEMAWKWHRKKCFMTVLVMILAMMESK